MMKTWLPRSSASRRRSRKVCSSCLDTRSTVALSLEKYDSMSALKFLFMLSVLLSRLGERDRGGAYEGGIVAERAAENFNVSLTAGKHHRRQQGQYPRYQHIPGIGNAAAQEQYLGVEQIHDRGYPGGERF